ncbi:PaaX family transcriptional regulator C-terminal domain-containing protein [Labedaea rhizosphaerae]|uniref:PaaX family transcriptional regulator C-terminal domain-containing protein n=1 Tax=Labedaea rhizosphaerae TaxID=598644 RepID=UPI0010615E24|nr:PaaX family transcriptional regulator C-terminal domain-containing protein [Labedaea rhizosphaerae]
MNDNASDEARHRFLARGAGPGIVAFLFGVAGRTALPGQVLHRLLTDLEMTDTAARAVIARMRRDGQLESVRHGRTAEYRLAGPFLESFHRVRDSGTRRPTPWTGAYHAVLHQVPESRRAYRDALRRAAVLGGFGILQPGVLISLTDRTAALGDLLTTVPDGARVYRAMLTMDVHEAAAAAWDAWNLAEVGALYRTHVATLTKAVRESDEHQPPTAETLRRFTELGRLPFVDTLRDPGLPPELVPPDWPGPALQRATVEVARRFAPAANAYVMSLLGP